MVCVDKLMYLILFAVFITTVPASVIQKNNEVEWISPRTVDIDPTCKVNASCTIEPSPGDVLEGHCSALCLGDTRILDDYLDRNTCGEASCRCCVHKKLIKRGNCVNRPKCGQFGGDCVAIGDTCDWWERPGKLPDLCDDGCFCCKDSWWIFQSDIERDSNNVHGDPQFRTFDKLHFKFDGHSGCSYVFFQECVPHPSFYVVIRHIYLEPVRKMVVDDVTIHVDDIAVTLRYGNDIFVNGKILTESLPWKHGELIVNKFDKHVKITLEAKFSLLWNGRGRVAPTLESSMFGKVCGLMGNADGNPDNDMQIRMSDGAFRSTNDTDAFGDSWLVPGSC